MACQNCGTAFCDCDNVVINKGDKGDQGIQGIQGVPGTGTAGADGNPGSLWFAGSGPPLSPGITNTDFYIDGDDGSIFNWDGSAWTDTGVDITGPIGPTGADGIASLWYTGSTAPAISPAEPSITHLFLNTVTGDVYKWIPGTLSWSLVANIIGPAGPAGIGTPGFDGPPGIDGVNGSRIYPVFSDPAGLNMADYNNLDVFWWIDAGDIHVYNNQAGVLTFITDLSCCASSGGGAETSFMFRAYKTNTQTLALGNVDNIVNFENDITAPGYDNGSNWTMNMWVASVDAAARSGGVNIIAENIQVQNSSVSPYGGNLTMWKYPVGGGARVAISGPLTIALAAGITYTAAILQSGFYVFTAGDLVRVIITTTSGGNSQQVILSTTNIMTA